ncbi:hypothetical protein, partial [Escherichia coli]|uniref:hypothetical protein n=1 Tax=Escherichia coli TaxID=562 RepID=UPI001BA8B675
QSPPPLHPGLWRTKSPLRGALELIPYGYRVGREVNIPVKRALSPHPCGLPRPSGNASAILTPPTPVRFVIKAQEYL